MTNSSESGYAPEPGHEGLPPEFAAFEEHFMNPAEYRVYSDEPPVFSAEASKGYECLLIDSMRDSTFIRTIQENFCSSAESQATAQDRTRQVYRVNVNNGESFQLFAPTISLANGEVVYGVAPVESIEFVKNPKTLQPTTEIRNLNLLGAHTLLRNELIALVKKDE